MGQKFASNKYSIAICDRCGFEFKLKQLKSLFIRTTKTNIKVCPECWNPDQPQNLQGMYPVVDPQAVQNPRPDTSVSVKGGKSSRGIQWGWNPVGGSAAPANQFTPNDLISEGKVGSVTISIT